MFRKLTSAVLFIVLLNVASLACFAQAAATPAAAQPAPGWTHVQALRTNTKIRITTDHGSRTCRIYSVTEDTLTCANGNAVGQVIQRTEIRKVVVHHYLRSTMSGLAIGVAAGAITGYAVGRSGDSCPNKSNCWDIIGPGAVAAVGAVAFGLPGAAIGGATDFTKGGAIYVRP